MSLVKPKVLLMGTKNLFSWEILIISILDNLERSITTQIVIVVWLKFMTEKKMK